MKPNHLINTLAFFFLIGNSILLLWFIFYIYYDHLHSDSATLALLAREIVETGQFFPQDWNYVNNDLFIFYKHILIIPLLAIIPAGFNAFAIASALYAGITLYVIWLITSFGNPSVEKRLFIVAICTLGLSGLMLENMYGQGAYGAIILTTCLIIYSSANYLDLNNQQTKFYGVLLIFLLVFVFWSNPKRAVITYGLPLLITVVLLTLEQLKNQPYRYISLIVLVLFSSVAGTYLHQLTLQETNNIIGTANAAWLSLEQALQQIPATFQGLYGLLGGLLPAGQAIATVDGAYGGLRFITATLLIILIPFAVIKALSKTCIKIKVLAFFTAFSLVLALLFQTATTIPDMASPLTSARYLIPSLLLAFVLISLLPISPISNPIWSTTVVLILCVFLTSSYDTLGLKYLFKGGTFTQLEQTNPERRKLLDILKTSGVKYGYATYWNAGSLTVLSDEQIKIRHVLFQDGLPVPYRHLSSNRWYRPQTWTGQTFLLLHKNEIANIDWQKMARLGLIPTETLDIDDFTLYIFAENLAKTLPFWDSSYPQPVRFLPGVTSQNQVGRLQDIDGVTALVADSGERGALHYGPYAEVKPGRYRITFDVRANHHPQGTLRLDVTASPEDKIYAERDLQESDAPQTLEFELEQTRKLEFRVWTLGNQPVTLRGITLERLTKD